MVSILKLNKHSIKKYKIYHLRQYYCYCCNHLYNQISDVKKHTLSKKHFKNFEKFHGPWDQCIVAVNKISK